MSYTHNTNISADIVLNLEDELDDRKLKESEGYKLLCEYIPQDILDNFLGWFGQESIERYVSRIKES